jgi:hypothetical protein
MKKLQRHWRTVLIVLVLVTGTGTLWWWRSAEARTAFLDEPQSPPTYDPLPLIQHDAIVNLLADMSLDRDALVGLNLTSSQAESVVSAVRTWYGTNQATLATLNQNIQQKRAAVYEREKAIVMGPADPANEPRLALVRQDGADAQAAYKAALAALETNVNTLLSETQRATWAAVRVGHGHTMPVRLLNLTDEQRLAVNDARQRYERQHAAASNDDERNAAITAWQNALDSILTVDQRSMVRAYYGYVAGSSTAVADALDTVLRVPG